MPLVSYRVFIHGFSGAGYAAADMPRYPAGRNASAAGAPGIGR